MIVEKTGWLDAVINRRKSRSKSKSKSESPRNSGSKSSRYNQHHIRQRRDKSQSRLLTKVSCGISSHIDGDNLKNAIMDRDEIIYEDDRTSTVDCRQDVETHGGCFKEDKQDITSDLEIDHVELPSSLEETATASFTQKNRISELEFKLKIADKEIFSLRDCIIELEKVKKQLEEDDMKLIQSLRDEISEIFREKNMLKSDMEKQMTTKHDEIIKLQETIQKQSNKTLAMEKQFINEFGDLGKLHANTAMELGKTLKREEHLKSQSISTEELKKQMSNLQSKYTKLLETSKQSDSSGHMEMEQLRARIVRLKEDKCEIIAHSEKELTTLESNLAEAGAVSESHKMCIDEINSKLEISDKQINTLKDKVFKLEEKRLKEEDIKKLQQTDLERKALVIVDLQKEISALTNERDHMETKCSKLQEKTEHTATTTDEHIQELMACVKRLQMEKEEITNDFAQERSELTHVLKQTEMATKSDKNHIHKLEMEIRQLNKKISAMEESFIGLCSVNEDLEMVRVQISKLEGKKPIERRKYEKKRA